MELTSLYHEAKSEFAYMYDAQTVHLRLRIKRGDYPDVKVIYGDPFIRGKSEAGNNQWQPYGDGLPMEIEGDTEEYTYYFIALSPTHLRMKYAFVINDTYLYGPKGTLPLPTEPSYRYDLAHYFNFPFLNDEDRFQAPAWVEEQIWYSIFPARFNNGDASLDSESTLQWNAFEDVSNADDFGGDLRGIIDRLDYLKAIGFTGIYMTPIFYASSKHKYDTIDYYRIDPEFGTNEDFRELVEKAHAKGMRIMLDGVFNHCGFHHPYFQDVLNNGKNSEYFEYFYIIDEHKPLLPFNPDDKTLSRDAVREAIRRNGGLNYRTFAFTPFMPKLKVMHPPLKSTLLDIARHWIEDYGVDGWRLDVSNEIPHAFWREFRQTVKHANNDTYIVGENWDNSWPWLMGDQYDGVMNYELLYPLWKFFGTENPMSALTFSRAVNRVLFSYPKHVTRALYNLLDSHDTPRIMHICGDDQRRVRLAYTFLFTYPGAPSVYYGGELGLSGGKDPDNRRCMPWEVAEDAPLKRHLSRLIELRGTNPQFKDTDFIWHQRNDALLAYEKGSTLIILNNQDTTASFTLPRAFCERTLQELLSNDTFKATSSITLSAFEAMILT